MLSQKLEVILKDYAKLWPPPPANQTTAETNQPFKQPPSPPVIDLSVCPDMLFLLEETSEEWRGDASAAERPPSSKL